MVTLQMDNQWAVHGHLTKNVDEKVMCNDLSKCRHLLIFRDIMNNAIFTIKNLQFSKTTVVSLDTEMLKTDK